MLAILLIGPIGIWIGSAISALVYTIHGYLGWLSVAIMGALWPLLVMTGMHRVFTPTIIQTIAETGKEGMVMPSEIGANQRAVLRSGESNEHRLGVRRHGAGGRAVVHPHTVARL